MAEEKHLTPGGGELPTTIAKERHPEDVQEETKGPSGQAEEQISDTGEEKKEGSIRDFIVGLLKTWRHSSLLTVPQRIFRYADRLDRWLYTIAFLCSIASGTALPLMTIIFGQFTAKFNNFVTGNSSAEAFRKNVDHFVLWFVYLFVGRFVIVYVANTCVSIAAIRTTRAIRKAFLESTLRQEVWHFDKESNGSISTQVTTSESSVVSRNGRI